VSRSLSSVKLRSMGIVCSTFRERTCLLIGMKIRSQIGPQIERGAKG
jgi:hypothetical protein